MYKRQFQTSFDEILFHFKYNTFLPVCKHTIPNYFCSHFVFYVYLYSVAKPLFWLLKECIKKQRPQKKSTVFCGWGGRIRTFGMTESESVALPLGDTPMFVRFSLFFGWDRWIRTIGMTESKSAALPLGYIPSSCPSLKQLNHYSIPFREMQYLFMFVYKAFTVH